MREQGAPPGTRSRVFARLAGWMLALGVGVGVLFPFIVVPLGVRPSDVLRPAFFVATIVAGLVVAGANWWLAHRVVGARIAALSAGMRGVTAKVATGRDLCGSAVVVDSTDHLGEAARAFNELVSALAEARALQLETQERLLVEATSDSLTRLPNRRLLIDRLDHAIDLAKRRNTCVTALFVDLDRFKQVNDEFGHAVGDEVIVAVAHRLTGAVRGIDTVARLGGDEFVVVCEDVRCEGTELVAERIRCSLALPIDLIDERQVQVTASVGAAYGSGDRLDARSLLKAADAALYRAKAQGRNCIVVEPVDAMTLVD